MRTACGWVQYKFGTAARSRRSQRLSTPERSSDLVREQAGQPTTRKKPNFRCCAAFSHFTARDAQGQKRYDRDQLVAWARERFHVDLDIDDLRNMQREEVQQMLVEYSRKRLRSGQSDAGRGSPAGGEDLRRRRQTVTPQCAWPPAAMAP